MRERERERERERNVVLSADIVPFILQYIYIVLVLPDFGDLQLNHAAIEG